MPNNPFGFADATWTQATRDAATTIAARGPRVRRRTPPPDPGRRLAPSVSSAGAEGDNRFKAPR